MGPLKEIGSLPCQHVEERQLAFPQLVRYRGVATRRGVHAPFIVEQAREFTELVRQNPSESSPHRRARLQAFEQHDVVGPPAALIAPRRRAEVDQPARASQARLLRLD